MSTTPRDLHRTTCQRCDRRTWAADAASACDECGQPVGQYGPSECAHCGAPVIGGTDLCHPCGFAANRED